MSDFNKGWVFCRENGKKEVVSLPHDAMLMETRKEACQNGDKAGYFPGGVYQYEKRFTLEKEEADKYVEIVFEGVYGRTSVEVNGIPVAEHAYGYTEFAVDISETVCEGENIIKVTVDNHLEPNSRWYSGSGIYRPVHLMIKDCLA